MLNNELDAWKIRDESERWSLISMFLRYHGDQFTRDDFILFLESIYRKPSKIKSSLSILDRI